MDIIWITTLVIAVIALLVAIGLVFTGKKFAWAGHPSRKRSAISWESPPARWNGRPPLSPAREPAT